MSVSELVEGLLQPSPPSNKDKELYDYYNKQAELVPISDIVYSTPNGQTRMRILASVLTKWRGSTLDVGCNDGCYKPFIEEYVGLDLARGFLTRFRGDRVQGTAESLPFKDEAFSHILLSETLEHVHHPLRVLEECWRVLVANGDMLITVPFGDDPKRVVSFGLVAYGCVGRVLHGCFSKPYLKMLLRKTGFTVKIMNVYPEAGGVTPCLIAHVFKVK